MARRVIEDRQERPRPRRGLRLFVGIYPPVEVVLRLIERCERLNLPAHRLVPAEQVHLTVQFVGNCPVSALEHLVESVQRATAGLAPFELILHSLITLPERGLARLAAAEADAPAPLLELKQRLATRLAMPGSRERRPFRPHLTILRFRTPVRVRIEESLVAERLVVPVERVLVMKSDLGPKGATHREVSSAALEGAGA